MDTDSIREDFPALQTTVNGKDLIYLDSAATTLTPQQVIDAVTDTLRRHGNPGRGVHTLSHETSQTVEEVREQAARFLGAAPDEIVFTHSATDSINQAATSLCQGEMSDSNIVITAADHHANHLPWKQATQRTGAELRIVAVNDDGTIDLEDLETKVDTDTHVLAFPHACNVTGRVFRVEEILRRGTEATHTVMDAAQSVPHMPVDLGDIGVDLAAVAPHKMLGTPGLGVLYGREEVLKAMEPARTGGGMVSDPAGPTYREPPHRHEAGSLPVDAIAGFGAAIAYLEDLGMDFIHQHTHDIARYAHKRLQQLEGATTVGGPPDTGTVSLTVEGIHPHDIASYLDQCGIEVRAGDHCSRPLIEALGLKGTVRISTYVYNTDDEIETAINAIEDAIEELPHV
jgi:cysteine desulfurase/selenocysteine lyase